MSTEVEPVRYRAIRRWSRSGVTVKQERIGLDRVYSAEETILRAYEVMARVGITRVANLTGLDCVGLPTVAVTRPNSRSVAVSMGKGLTLAAAKASGIMEAIEGFHAERIDQPLRLCSLEELSLRGRAIDIAKLARLSVGSFTSQRKILWIEGNDIIQDQPCWVPYEIIHTDYSLPLPTGSGAFLMSSNGLASGNHLLEAVSHAVCEVVERDANALWTYSPSHQKSATRLALDSVDDEGCLTALRAFDNADIDVCAWDTTTDIGIPSFRCQVADRHQARNHPLHPVAGSGCHPRREIALLRALTEAAQGRLTLISGARDDLSQNMFQQSNIPLKLLEFAAERDQEGVMRGFKDAPTHDSPSLEGDVAWQLDRLECAGVREVVVVDLSKEEFAIPVVRVVIPGLESICEAPGYLPGARARNVMRVPA